MSLPARRLLMDSWDRSRPGAMISGGGASGRKTPRWLKMLDSFRSEPCCRAPLGRRSKDQRTWLFSWWRREHEKLARQEIFRFWSRFSVIYRRRTSPTSPATSEGTDDMKTCLSATTADGFPSRLTGGVAGAPSSRVRRRSQDRDASDFSASSRCSAVKSASS